MKYEKIHDSIINRALMRTACPNTYYENHHILPICEQGCSNGKTVKLTLKEHRIIHKLRYKFTGVIGNLYAYNLMKRGEASRTINASIAAKQSHILYKKRDYEKYIKRQVAAGIQGGNSAKEKKSGIHSMSEDDLQAARERGRKTTIENKYGMFSDDYRKQHRNKMKKTIKIEDRVFNSCTEAADFFNVVPGTISYWIKTGKATIINEGIYSYKGIIT